MNRTLAPATIVLIACATAPPPATAGAGAWAAPADWKSETIPFPLDFAPALSHRGVEEVRFAPGFMKPAAPDFWSYVFAWRLEDDGAADASVLSRQLVVYFRGLVTAVNADTHVIPALDPDRFAARLAPEGDALVGAVDSYDPFVTGKALTLHARVRVQGCGGGRRAIVFELSPAPLDGPVGAQLGAVASALRCGA